MHIRTLSLTLRAVCFAILLLLPSACSSASPIPTMDPTQAANLLAGVYSTTITQEDVTKLDALDADIASNVGVWKITIKNDGKGSAVLGADQNTIDISYELNGNEIKVFIHNGGCSGNIGRYQWKLKDKELNFGKIVDLCAGEVLLLTSHPLVRVSE